MMNITHYLAGPSQYHSLRHQSMLGAHLDLTTNVRKIRIEKYKEYLRSRLRHAAFHNHHAQVQLAPVDRCQIGWVWFQMPYYKFLPNLNVKHIVRLQWELTWNRLQPLRWFVDAFLKRCLREARRASTHWLTKNRIYLAQTSPDPGTLLTARL